MCVCLCWINYRENNNKTWKTTTKMLRYLSPDLNEFYTSWISSTLLLTSRQLRQKPDGHFVYPAHMISLETNGYIELSRLQYQYQGTLS